MNLEIERYEGELRKLRQAATQSLEILSRFTTMKTKQVENVVFMLQDALREKR